MSRWMMIVFIVLLSAGCSSMQVEHDYDPAVAVEELQTYAFVPSEDQNDTLQYERTLKAITAHLEGKGYEQTTFESADFHVRFESRIDRDVPGNVSFGLGLGTFTSNMGISVGTSQRPLNDEGVLHVDMLSPQTQSLLWRGSVRDVLHDNDTLTARELEIKRLVDALLESFPEQGSGKTPE